MSERYFTQIYNDIIRSDKFTPSEKVVLFVLMSYDNCDKIFINQKTLAKEAGVSRDTVVRALKGLRKKKMLTTKEKPDRSTLVYELTEGEVVANSDKGCSKLQQGVVANSDTSNIKERNIKLKKEKNKKETEIDLPEWLDKKMWAEWVQHRKQKRQKLTDLTIKKQLKLLEENQKDHVAIIDRSITNGWTGLFPLKEKSNPEEKDYSKAEEMINEARKHKRNPRNLC